MKSLTRIFSIAVATLLLCCSAQVTFSQTIHVVIAGNHIQNNADFNQAVDADVKSVREYFKKNVAPDDLKIVEIDSDKMTPQLVADTIATLQPVSTDTVVFYYTGQGATDSAAGGNYLIFTNDKGEISTLSRKQIKDYLKAKKAHLNIMITDTCNHTLKRTNPVEPKGTDLGKLSLVLSSKQAKTARIIDELFIKPTGTVDIIVAQGEEQALYQKTTGGIGTTTLIETLNKLNKTLSGTDKKTLVWSDFMTEYQMASSIAFKKTYPQGVGNQKNQTPYAYELPVTPRVGVRVISLPEGNVKITEILPNSPGQKAGLRINDVIVNINGTDIKNETDYSQAVDKSQKKMMVIIKGIDTPFYVNLN